MPASPTRATPLSRDDVVRAVRELARTHGLDGLTMRAVAAALDVTPMATYYHVRNKDELIGLVAESVLATTEPLRLGPEGWEAALRAHLVSLWEALAEYPGLAADMINLPTLGTTGAAYKAGAEFFEEAGFTPRLAGLAWSFALTYIHGRLSVDARLDREAAHAEGLDAFGARRHVRFGVEAVIIGLRAIHDDPSRVDLDG